MVAPIADIRPRVFGFDDLPVDAFGGHFVWVIAIGCRCIEELGDDAIGEIWIGDNRIVRILPDTLNLIDTAGIRETEDIVENIGVTKAKDYAEKADLILYVVDGTKEMDEADEEIWPILENKKVIILLNKSDLDNILTKDELEEKFKFPVIPISAKEETGINILEDTLKDMFFQGEISFNDEVYYGRELKEFKEWILWYRTLTKEEKEKLFEELSYKDKLSKAEALKILFGKNAKGYDLNYKDLEGNRTLFELFKAYFNIIELSGRDCESLLKLSSKEMVSAVRDVFKVLGIDTDILVFNSDDNPTKQPIYNLWHLLYSFEGDNSNTGDEKLIELLSAKYGLSKEQLENKKRRLENECKNYCRFNSGFKRRSKKTSGDCSVNSTFW